MGKENQKEAVVAAEAAAAAVGVCWLLSIPPTCECISGTNLFRQLYLLPHWDRSCRSNFLSHPVTVCWHRSNHSQHWPYSARCPAGKPLECHFLSHWYDSTPEKSRRKRDSNPGSSSLEAGALATRPMRQSAAVVKVILTIVVIVTAAVLVLAAAAAATVVAAVETEVAAEAEMVVVLWQQ